MRSTYTCLIPFYNEGERVLSTIKIISKSALINQIICIDDGSNDGASVKIQKSFPNIKVIILSKNRGKANALKEGLMQVKTEYALMFDADLYDIKLIEIENAIKKIDKNEYIDSIILRRIVESWIVSKTRHDVIMSGQRILKTKDFIRVFETNPNGYAIETAINAYMIKHNKKVFWMPLSTKNPKKHTKAELGIVKAIRLYTNTFIGYFSSVGLSGYLKQILTFCKQEAV